MKNYPIWKTFIVFIVVVLAIIFSIPSFLYKEDTKNTSKNIIFLNTMYISMK